MNENLNRFETLKLATQYWHGDEETSTIIIVSFLLIFIILLAGGFLLQRYLKLKNAKLFFVKFAKNKGLNDKEIEVLWSYAIKMERDPMLVLEFKAPFEKVVDLYIKTDPAPDEALIQDIRKKLDFIIQSPYVPLITTKDIEVFQNGRMIFSNNKAINVALYDKDERYMYWLAVDNDFPNEIVVGETVKVVFVRNEDGIYTVTLPIVEIIKEDGKTLIKLPHTFELHRTQRREYPRIKIDKDIRVKVEEKVEFPAKLIDISAGGGHFCFDKSNEVYKKLRFGDEITLKVKLIDNELPLTLKILEKDVKPKRVCIRGLFVNLDEYAKEQIMDYVQRELLKKAQLKRGR